MKIHVFSHLVLAVLAGSCLATACLLVKHWILALMILGSTVVWFILRRSRAAWARWGLLLVYVLLAAIGATLGASSLLVLFGLSCALAAWERREISCTAASDVGIVSAATPDRPHRLAVGLMLACTGLIALALALVKLSLPFWSAVLLSLGATVSIVCLVHSTRKVSE